VAIVVVAAMRRMASLAQLTDGSGGA
jgi:hypothetical protein